MLVQSRAGQSISWSRFAALHVYHHNTKTPASQESGAKVQLQRYANYPLQRTFLSLWLILLRPNNLKEGNIYSNCSSKLWKTSVEFFLQHEVKNSENNIKNNTSHPASPCLIPALKHQRCVFQTRFDVWSKEMRKNWGNAIISTSELSQNLKHKQSCNIATL